MREFTVSAAGQTILGATTLVALNPIAAPNFGIRLLRAWAAQSQNATSAQQRVQIGTQAAVFPTVVGQTPQKVKRQDPNASVLVSGVGGAGTAGINASAEGAGVKTPIIDDAFNVLNGWSWQMTPNEVIELPAGFAGNLYLFFPVAPTNLANWAFGFTYQEF